MGWIIVGALGGMLWGLAIIYIGLRGIRQHLWEIGSDGEIILTLQGKSAVIAGWCSLFVGAGVVVGFPILILYW